MGREPYSDRLIVEDCYKVSIKTLNNYGLFKNKLITGTIDNKYNFVISTFKPTPYMSLEYYIVDKLGLGQKINPTIYLTYTVCFYGGIRWWFKCPVVKNGVQCNKRVGVLYLTPRGKYFACRHCYNLTYRSCKENHKYDSLFKFIDKVDSENYLSLLKTY